MRSQLRLMRRYRHAWHLGLRRLSRGRRLGRRPNHRQRLAEPGLQCAWAVPTPGSTPTIPSPRPSTKASRPTAIASIRFKHRAPCQTRIRRPRSQRSRPVDDTNVNFSIIVGRTSFGELIINQSQLRDMDLVIGDSGHDRHRDSNAAAASCGSKASARSTTTIPSFCRISVVDPDTAVSPSQDVPRPDERRLRPVRRPVRQRRPAAGARRPRRNSRCGRSSAIKAAASAHSLIDGIDSFLQSGGFETASNDPDEVNYMIVGRLGSGTMSITNGGQSYNSGPTSADGGNNDVFAAVIGSNLAAIDQRSARRRRRGHRLRRRHRFQVDRRRQFAGRRFPRQSHRHRTARRRRSWKAMKPIYGSGVGRGTLERHQWRAGQHRHAATR